MSNRWLGFWACLIFTIVTAYVMAWFADFDSIRDQHPILTVLWAVRIAIVTAGGTFVSVLIAMGAEWPARDQE